LDGKTFFDCFIFHLSSRGATGCVNKVHAQESARLRTFEILQNTLLRFLEWTRREEYFFKVRVLYNDCCISKNFLTGKGMAKCFGGASRSLASDVNETDEDSGVSSTDSVAESLESLQGEDYSLDEALAHSWHISIFFSCKPDHIVEASDF
jgi:hypothetical protein